jgi:hypothetical protein
MAPRSASRTLASASDGCRRGVEGTWRSGSNAGGRHSRRRRRRRRRLQPADRRRRRREPGVAQHRRLLHRARLLDGLHELGRQLTQSTALWIGTSCLAVFVVLLPLIGWLSDHLGRRPLLIASCVGYAAMRCWAILFLDGLVGQCRLAIAAQLLMVLLYVPYAGTCPAFYAEIFPTHVRYTAFVERLQYRGRNLRRVCAVHRHISGAGDTQRPRAGFLCHHRGARDPRHPAPNEGDRVHPAAFTLIGDCRRILKLQVCRSSAFLFSEAIRASMPLVRSIKENSERRVATSLIALSR